MKIYLVVFLAVLLLFVLLGYPFKVCAKVHINLIKFKAFYSLKVMFIKLLCGTTYIEDNNLIIQNTHNLIYNSQQNTKKQMLIMQNIAKRISVAKLQVYFSGGVKNNAYQTAMLCGYAYAITSAMLAYLITKNNCINIFQDIDPQYSSDALDITLKCVLEISMLDVIGALIVSAFKFKEVLDDKTK